MIDALACFRITRLITTDSLTRQPRERFQEWCLEGRHLKLLEVSSCGWCAGQWVAFGVVAARRFAPRLWGPVAMALALSAVAGIVSEAT